MIFGMHRAKRKSNLLILLLATVLIAAGGAWKFYTPLRLQRAMENTLAQYGLSAPAITSYERQKDGILFHDITFGNEREGKIEALKAETNNKLFLQSPAFSMLKIEGFSLSIKIAATGLPEAGSFLSEKLLAEPLMNDFIIKKSSLEIETPTEPVKVNLEGHGHQNDNGERVITFNLSAAENIFATTAQTDVVLKNTKEWSLAANIADLRLNFKNITLNQTGGWINLEVLGKNTAPKITAQIDSRHVRLGENTVFTDISGVFKGSPQTYHIILQGQSAPPAALPVYLEINKKDNAASLINASIEAGSIGDLTQMMTLLNKDLQKFEIGRTALTSLVLTPGNITRIRENLAGMIYDRLELVINGTPDNLNGKIVIKMIDDNNAIILGVISMNPADSTSGKNQSP